MGRPRKDQYGNEYLQKRLPNGKRVTQMVGADPAVPDAGKKFHYSRERADKVIDLFMRLPTMRAVAQELKGSLGFDDFEVGVIYYWMQHHADFALKMKEARKLRGLYHEQKALEEADTADEGNVQSQRLKVDTHKWAAGVNDPDTYGSKTKVVGDPNQPIAILIDTGIVRQSDPPTGALPVTTPPGESK